MPCQHGECSVEDRLLSPAGIPKLRRITKERLRFKGKGHEVDCHSELSDSVTDIFLTVLGCRSAAERLSTMAGRLVPTSEVRGRSCNDQEAWSYETNADNEKGMDS